MKFNRLLSVAILAIAAHAAHAHFLWASYENPAGKKIRIEFAESPGDSVLPAVAGRAKDVKTWENIPVVQEDEGLVGFTKGQVGGAILHYGVLDRSEQQRGIFLLEYYAKACSSYEVASKPAGMRAEVVVVKAGGKLTLQALLDGKPAGGAEFTYFVGKEEKTANAGADGKLTIDHAAANFMGRAMIAEKKSGSLDGKKYDLVRNYATLAIGKPVAPSKADPVAYKLLEGAAVNRASFPEKLLGLHVEFTASVGKKEIKGTLTMDDASGVTIGGGDESPEFKWVSGQMRSMFLHRRSGRFEDGDGSHPLKLGDDENSFGRLILVGDSFNSKYRVKDGQILEVDRTMGKERILVNVLQTMRTRENRVLSTRMSVMRFDATNKILGSEIITDSFADQDGVWLPKSRSVLMYVDGQAEFRTIEFGSAKLVLK